MSEKKFYHKVSKVRRLSQAMILGNTVVGHREKFQYQLNGEDYWYEMSTTDEMRTLSRISDLDYMGNVVKTPEGQALYDEWKAKDEDDEDED